MSKKKVDLIGMKIGTKIPIKDIIKALNVPMPSDKELILELNDWSSLTSLRVERLAEIILLSASNYTRRIALKKLESILSKLINLIDISELNYLYNRLFNSDADEIIIRAINNFYLNKIKANISRYLYERNELERILRDRRLSDATRKKIVGMITKSLIAKITEDLNDPSKPIEYFWKVFALEEWPYEFNEIITKAKAGLRKIYKAKLSARIKTLIESELFDLSNKIIVNRDVDEWFKTALTAIISQICHEGLKKDYLSPEMIQIASIFACEYEFDNNLVEKLKKFINKRSVEEINNSRPRCMTLERALEIYYHSFSNAQIKRLAKMYINRYWRTRLRIDLDLEFNDISKIDKKEVERIFQDELSGPLTKKMAIKVLAKLYPAN